VSAALAGDEGGHGLVSAARLELVVAGLEALALAALEDAVVVLLLPAGLLALELAQLQLVQRLGVEAVWADGLRRVLCQLAGVEQRPQLRARLRADAVAEVADDAAALELRQQMHQLCLVGLAELAAVPGGDQLLAPLGRALRLGSPHSAVAGVCEAMHTLDRVVVHAALDVARSRRMLDKRLDLHTRVLAERVIHSFGEYFFRVSSMAPLCAGPVHSYFFLVQLV